MRVLAVVALAAALLAGACSQTCDAVLNTLYSDCTCSQVCGDATTTKTIAVCTEDLEAARTEATYACMHGSGLPCASPVCTCTCASTTRACQVNELCK